VEALVVSFTWKTRPGSRGVPDALHGRSAYRATNFVREELPSWTSHAAAVEKALIGSKREPSANSEKKFSEVY
jgi:hypothetical protein